MLTMEFLAEKLIPLKGVPPPRVFFVRVANTGLMLDAARKSGKCET